MVAQTVYLLPQLRLRFWEIVMDRHSPSGAVEHRTGRRESRQAYTSAFSALQIPIIGHFKHMGVSRVHEQ